MPRTASLFLHGLKNGLEAKKYRIENDLALWYKRQIKTTSAAANTAEVIIIDAVLIQFLDTCIKLVVSSLLRKQVVVVTALDYLAVFKHHNGVGVSYR